MKAKPLLNPRGYLSYTQIELWRKDPKRYIRQYIHGESGFENAGMRFGKRTSDALENGADGDDLLMEAAVALIPAYAKREHEIRATLKDKDGRSVVLLGKLDTFDPKTPRFREYKTGKVPWTQARANKHWQLPFYAALIMLDCGKIPKDTYLDWIETEYTDYGVQFTGNIKSYRVEIDMLRVLDTLAVAMKAAREIDAAYRAEMKTLS